jgi:hypothetical protein
VLSWLLKTAHNRGGAPDPTQQTSEAIDVALKNAKLLKVNGALIAEAEDLANKGVVTVMTAFRNALRGPIPGALYDAATKAADRTEGEDAIAAVLDHELQRLQPKRREQPPAAIQQPAKEPPHDHA